MPTQSAPERYLSLNEVARTFEISYPTALKLYASGVLKPDAHQGRTALFKASRSEELRKTIRANVITYVPREVAQAVNLAPSLNLQA